MPGLIEIDRNPSPRVLHWFGRLLVLFVILVGILVREHWEAPRTALTIWCAGGLLATVFWIFPRLRRRIYVGWIYAVYPIGWTVSHLLLALAYYFVLSPIGLILRLFREDPLERKPDFAVNSYWKRRKQREDSLQYFKQF